MTVIKLQIAYENMCKYIEQNKDLVPVSAENAKEHVQFITHLIDACGAIKGVLVDACSKEIAPLVAVKETIEKEYEFTNNKLRELYAEPVPNTDLIEFLNKQKGSIYGKMLEVQQAISDKEVETQVELDKSLMSIISTYYN